MNQENLIELQKISTPKVFAKNEYICYEGQPGNEMYIILKGVIGIYVTSPIGTLTEVAELKQGDFFGEMAIFDNLPRSASCIAKDDTVCIAVTKENLSAFIGNCPDMAAKMVENMSARIRKLDNELYKNIKFVQNQHVPRFKIPVEYCSHAIKAPHHDAQFVSEYKQACPVCSRAVTIVNLRKNILQMKSIDLDGRINYMACEPLWLDVVSCPHCYYTNHHLSFFKVVEANLEKTRNLLKDQHAPIVENNTAIKSDMDWLVLKYLQAININENFNSSDNTLLGTLWMNLYWLAKDAKDENFAKYCAGKAVEKYMTAIDDNEIFDKTGRCTIALSLTNLLIYTGMGSKAPKYCEIAIECPDERIKKRAVKVWEALGR